MNKKSIISSIVALLIIFVIYLAFPQKHEPITFDGQGDHWRAEVVTKSKSLNKEEVTTTLKYIGKEKNSIGDFDYTITSSIWAWGMGAFDLNAQKSFTNKETINTFKKIKADNSFKVTVNWEGKTETFSLTHK